MNTLLTIAAAEWRYWRRSRLALAAAALFFMLLLVTVVLTSLRVQAERDERLHHQQEAEQTFIDQPDRHPHRMVHYGHYVFRTPSPLAVFDPGLDPVTGQSIFLEGHRQNSATFADSAASADLGGLARLTPAVVYQLFGALLVMLLGHGAMVREREAATLAPMLAQGVTGTQLLLGKALALLGAIAIMLLPLLGAVIGAVPRGETLAAGLALAATYLMYLCVWGLLTLLFSALLSRRSTVLAVLTGLWLSLSLLLPSLATNFTARSLPIAGQIETDLTMLADLRRLGDGHNAQDPAFAQLRSELLQRYDADSVEELPVNWRGVVAEYSEARLTETLNEYAEARMAQEAAQAALLARHGWLTPFLATATASRALAATDLDHHQRFLREAEALRIDFVQGLNRLHAQELSYEADTNRNRDAEAARRARVSADNWQLLREFRYAPLDPFARLANAGPSLTALAAWFAALAIAVTLIGRRLSP
ncbi:MAG: DUF3526 domain-containing protein [Halieaceae bacterium]|jgi:ABC-2 type transport system permease protein|nr:DUF3526 domain-containing protein [Halieaceae bacterium]